MWVKSKQIILKVSQSAIAIRLIISLRLGVDEETEYRRLNVENKNCL